MIHLVRAVLGPPLALFVRQNHENGAKNGFFSDEIKIITCSIQGEDVTKLERTSESCLFYVNLWVVWDQKP